MNSQHENFDENTEQLKGKLPGINPIFGFEPRDKEKPLPPGFDPGYLEDATMNSDILCFPTTGRQSGKRAIYYLAPDPQNIDETVLQQSSSDNLIIEKVSNQEVEALPLETANVSAWPTQPATFNQQNNYIPTVNIGMLQLPSELPDESRAAVCNYIVTPLRKLVYHDRNGQEIKEMETFECELISGHGSENFMIHTREIRKLTAIIADKFSYAEVNQNAKKADKIIERRFRNATKSIPVLHIYCEAGWVGINNQYVYGFDGLRLNDDTVFQTGLTLPSYPMSDYEAGLIFFDAYNLYFDKGPMSVMITFAFLGILYKLFEEAGHPVHFVLFLNGKTGSGKTTLGLILFVQLADDHHRTTPRRIDADTVVSFERGIVTSGRDTVTLIDDFSPAKTPHQKKMMDEKLESIIRMVGDGSTKSRSNTSLEDCRGEGVKGVVAITGELTGKGLSSNLRCFYCGIQRDKVNFETVSKFQDYPCSFTTLVQKFSEFVADDWINIVDFIKKGFECQRIELNNYFEQRRLVDSTATLRITADIIGWFLQEKCGQPADKIQGMMGEMKENILNMGILSENLSSEDTPIVIAVRAIDQLIWSNQVRLLQHKPDEQQLEEVDGFLNGDFVYFVPEKLFGKVREYFSLTGMYFPFDLNEFAKVLCDEGVACSSSNGPNKRTCYARLLIGRSELKRNFIKINLRALKQFVEQ